MEHSSLPPQSAVLETQHVVDQYAELFVQRFDTFSRQRDGSRSYYRVRDRAERSVPLTSGDIQRHLRGEITLGLYSVDQRGLTKWSVIDSDVGVAPLLKVQATLGEQDISSYLETSRAGGHLWIFWQERLQPRVVKALLSPLTGALELFPAGDIPDEDGLGLCIRAPLGLHRLTMQRYGFVNPDLSSLVPGSLVRGQVQWLMTHVRRAEPGLLQAAVGGNQREVASPRGGIVYETNELRPIAKFVDQHACRAVIGRFVALNRRGVGRCPWGHHHKHGDRHPSFQVFDSTNRWWCYAERRGGNAFDFLCLYWQMSPGQVLVKLRFGL